MRFGRLHLAVAMCLLPVVGKGTPPFDCFQITAPDERPTDCDDPNNPFYNPNGTWCACLKSGITANVAGDYTTIEEAIMDAYHEPTVGIFSLSVGAGTLDLTGVKLDDDLGQFVVDIPKELLGAPEDFLLDFHLIVTGITDDAVLFDIKLEPVNQTTIAILTYDPTDSDHSDGLSYQGSVAANVPGSGFNFKFAYLTADQLPPGVNHFGIEEGDLLTPGLNVPFLFRFPAPDLYRLPDAATLHIETLVGRYGDDYGSDPYHPDISILDPFYIRTFDGDFDLQPAADHTPPAAPTGLVTTAGDGQVSLDWNDNGESDLDGYLVLRTDVAEGQYTQVATPAASAYLDTGLHNGTTYYYVVKAVDKAKNPSAASGEVFATPADPVPPAVPTGLTAAAGDGQVSLDWNDSAESDLDRYSVQRSETAGGPYEEVATPSASAYVDAGLVNGKTYYYVVEALDKSRNRSGPSSEVSATPVGAVLKQHVRGDANDDAKVDVSDAVTNLNFQFLGGQALSCKGSLDFDSNGKLEVTDPILILNVLFLGDPNRPVHFGFCESFDAAVDPDCAMPAGYTCPANP